MNDNSTHAQLTPAQPAPGKTKNNFLLFVPLVVLTVISCMAVSIAVMIYVSETLGYDGRRGGAFAIGGLFLGYGLVWPLWWMYRKRYPKAERPAAPTR